MKDKEQIKLNTYFSLSSNSTGLLSVCWLVDVFLVISSIRKKTNKNKLDLVINIFSCINLFTVFRITIRIRI